MKACPICTELFTPKRMGQKGCSPICQREIARQRKLVKDKLDRLKTKRDYLREAQIEFNRYIRERDRLAGLPCISCGAVLGGNYHAGHYRSVGAAPQHRFDERNVHGQCIACNLHKHGNAIEYRIRLIERIGIDAVESLERDNGVMKWTADELKALKERYRRKWQSLKRGGA